MWWARSVMRNFMVSLITKNSNRRKVLIYKFHKKCLKRSTKRYIRSANRNLRIANLNPEVLSFASDKAKLFAKNFSKNSYLDDSSISIPSFPSRTNLKLHNIFVTPMMVKKVIMNFHSSKASGPDCIPVVALKKCEPELSYILAELLNMCLKESCFPDCWKVSSVVPVF